MPIKQRVWTVLGGAGIGGLIAYVLIGHQWVYFGLIIGCGIGRIGGEYFYKRHSTAAAKEN